MIDLGTAGYLGHRVLVLSAEVILMTQVSARGEALARRVPQTENIDLHKLKILVECLVLSQHLHVLIVQLEFGHCVNRVDGVLLHCEVIHQLSCNVAFFISLRLDLNLLCPVLLLNILVVHDVV